MSRYLTTIVLVLCAMTLGACPAGVPAATPPTVTVSLLPSVSRPTPRSIAAPTASCQPAHCDGPVADPLLQGLGYVAEHYPEQGCDVSSWNPTTVDTPAGVFWVLKGGKCAVMVPYEKWEPIVVTNDTTGFRWEGRMGGRFVRNPCCSEGGYSVPEVVEQSVAVPTAATNPTERPCTPEPCKPVAQEHGTLVSLLDYFGKHYSELTSDLRGYTWMISMSTWYTPAENQYVITRGEWLILIPHGDPPYRVVAEQKAKGFRWEGIVDWRPAWDNCRCYFESEVTELYP